MRVSFHTAVIPILRILVLSACGEAPEPDNPAYWTLSFLELGAEGGVYPSALYIPVAEVWTSCGSWTGTAARYSVWSWAGPRGSLWTGMESGMFWYRKNCGF